MKFSIDWFARGRSGVVNASGLRLMPLWILLSALVLAGCPKPQSSVQLKGRTFSVEVAKTDASRAQGLMFRESMPSDAGMVFIFDDAQPRAFWMHNCKMALDILYFDEQLRFVSAALSVPPCNLPPERCPNYPSEGAAKYTLELNAGLATELGVKKGDLLTLDLRE
jgi:uncharacterized protein